MAVIHPFNAWRPKTDEVEQIACVPYDVVSVEEARTMAAGNPKSFLHVVRPEIDLPEDTDPYHDEVYDQGAENLRQLITDGTLTQDDEPCIYIYQLIRKGRRQTGIFTCVSVDDYDNEVILKHELTRPKKEDDRTKHILTQQAHAEPVMLTYKDNRQVQSLIDEVVQTDPLFDFKAEDGVIHKIWKTAYTDEFVKTFKDISNLYIADGHHRCKAASRAAETKRQENASHTGDEAYNFFPAVIFPMSNMHIMAYNRVIYSVPENFYQTLDNKFDLSSVNDPTPSEKGNICIYINGQWYKMQLPITDNPNSVEQLDVHRLQEHLLAPLLDITDPRRDDNISFVGGIRGTGELEELVDNNSAEMAISMYPTDISELVEVSDAGKLMPPKSTWFEPKLRSGLLVHTF
ncbi:Uncharacterized conserved protein, DUF1015 family [Fodinibius salinus]|uniref:Uncharacterized conserved protein, DUF1015 family n=1 Tax=Fodinibius salinus TaxID=860790 RepID=A0A5D3YIG3_9BACT|nr:DUF1015 family protein [Fodinibius salinus]TYP92525.1 Uncharacterized conserved protein, DUF1015 family [Fodinibius salinus]